MTDRHHSRAQNAALERAEAENVRLKSIIADLAMVITDVMDCITDVEFTPGSPIRENVRIAVARANEESKR